MPDGSQTRIYVYLPPHVSSTQEASTFELMAALAEQEIDVRILSKARGMSPVLQRGHLVIRIGTEYSTSWITQGGDWKRLEGADWSQIVEMLSVIMASSPRNSREVRPLARDRKEVVLLTNGMTRRGREQFRELFSTYTHVGPLGESDEESSWIKNDGGDFVFVCVGIDNDLPSLTIHYKGEKVVDSDYAPGTDPKVVYYDALSCTRSILKDRPQR